MRDYMKLGKFEIVKERPITENSKRLRLHNGTHSPHWKRGAGVLQVTVDRWDNGNLSFDISEYAEGGATKRVMFELPSAVAELLIKFQQTGDFVTVGDAYKAPA